MIGSIVTAVVRTINLISICNLFERLITPIVQGPMSTQSITKSYGWTLVSEIVTFAQRWSENVAQKKVDHGVFVTHCCNSYIFLQRGVDEKCPIVALDEVKVQIEV